MRMGFNALNAQRCKYMYNFINDNMCPLCNMRAENTRHYFLFRPALATPPATLLPRLFQILRNLPNQCFVFCSPILVRVASLVIWLKPPAGHIHMGHLHRNKCFCFNPSPQVTLHWPSVEFNSRNKKIIWVSQTSLQGESSNNSLSCIVLQLSHTSLPTLLEAKYWWNNSGCIITIQDV